MKVLLITDYSAQEGGAEILMSQLRRLLRAAGHDARLFASSATPSGLSRTADYECFGTISRWRTLLQTANPWAAMRLREVLADFRPDVVHVGMFLTQLSPLILPVLAPWPVLYQLLWARIVCPTGTRSLPDGRECPHSPGLACLQEGCLPLHDWAVLNVQQLMVRRWQQTLITRIPLSAALGEVAARFGLPCDSAVNPGVPVPPVQPNLAAEPTVAFAGRLVREKGVDWLLRSFARAGIPGSRLILLGDGPERATLVQLAADLGLRNQVDFRGHVPREACDISLNRAWIQVMPSLWQEPFGIALSEAMARGTAAAASRNAGSASLIRDGETGWLLNPGDEPGLADVLRTALTSRQLCERIGSAAREHAAEHLSEQHYLAQILKHYELTIHRKRGGLQWPHGSDRPGAGRR